MRIFDIGTKSYNDIKRVEAKVEWEETDRSPFQWYVETDKKYQPDFWPNPNAWLLGSILPAWHAREKRVQVEGMLCPILLAKLKIALSILERWYPEMGPTPAIESTEGIRAYRETAHAESASLLTCGVDSMATLCWNRKFIPLDNPRSIKGVFFVEFIENPSMEDNLPNDILLRRKLVKRVAESIGVDAIRVKTNIWELDGDGWFYTYKWHGAALSAMAHFFSKRFNRTYLATSIYQDILFRPWGSHPLLDPCYSSGDMEIEHDGRHLFRYEKIALIADWTVGLRNILVCQGEPSTEMNCGACMKCLFTMAALVALGKLDKAETFPYNDITPDLLNTLIDYDLIYRIYQVEFLESLIPALTGRGRVDLVSVIRRFRPYLIEKELKFTKYTKIISRAVPDGQLYALADNKNFGGSVEDSNKGRFWGLPKDGLTAISELKELRKIGINYIVFTPETIWWLDHFDKLGDYLDKTCVKLHLNEKTTIFHYNH